ncbi:hypothetical protein COHA_000483 [Chlorella ohadii]|uniref:Hint domain-containing protein n=1 Tax=Chlorella ohadii TaxID=2649997 RepID=A0AAD5DYG0_9CHLO|nr:hypothetical protein COHA_000483 [Chlorella ohadii]
MAYRGQWRSRALLLCILAGCLQAALAGGRGLAQSSDGTYDAGEVECKAAEELCNKISCSGLIKFSCDPADSTNSKCTCVSGGLASCFPGSATVATPGGPKRLSQLSLGEQVLAVDASTGRLQFSPVYMWSSRRPSQAAQFVTVRTDAGLNITITPGHYLFAWRGAGAAAAAEAALPRPAAWPYVLPAQLVPGDVVPVAAADWSGDRRLVLARVTAVEREEGEGVYMPHTLTGAIIVDGVAASELTSLVPQVLAGSHVHRGLVAGLRLAFKAFPPHAVEAAVRSLSSLLHGGVADAAVSHQALFS